MQNAFFCGPYFYLLRRQMCPFRQATWWQRCSAGIGRLGQSGRIGVAPQAGLAHPCCRLPS